MIILDTNVLSALMQVAPDTAVIDWLDRQPAESIWITSITLFEAHLGIAQSAQPDLAGFEQGCARQLPRPCV